MSRRGIAGDETTGVHRPEQVGAAGSERLERALLDRLAVAPGLTSTTSDVLDGLGFALAVPATRLQPRLAAAVAVGHAVTLRYLAERRTIAAGDAAQEPKLAHRTAFEAAAQGDVLVIDAFGVDDVSAFGAMAAAQAQVAGLAGVIVDGGVRDLAEIAELRLPLWSRAVSPRTGKWRLEAVGINVAVGCGGVQVRPGDLVVADANGVCFVPPARAREVVADVLEVADRERAALRAR